MVVGLVIGGCGGAQANGDHARLPACTERVFGVGIFPEFLGIFAEFLGVFDLLGVFKLKTIFKF